jgi:hypothetical protein
MSGEPAASGQLRCCHRTAAAAVLPAAGIGREDGLRRIAAHGRTGTGVGSLGLSFPVSGPIESKTVRLGQNFVYTLKIFWATSRPMALVVLGPYRPVVPPRERS